LLQQGYEITAITLAEAKKMEKANRALQISSRKIMAFFGGSKLGEQELMLYRDTASCGPVSNFSSRMSPPVPMKKAVVHHGARAYRVRHFQKSSVYEDFIIGRGLNKALTINSWTYPSLPPVEPVKTPIKPKPNFDVICTGSAHGASTRTEENIPSQVNDSGLVCCDIVAKSETKTNSNWQEVMPDELWKELESEIDLL
jgi:hypothetical protein